MAARAVHDADASMPSPGGSRRRMRWGPQRLERLRGSSTAAFTARLIAALVAMFALIGVVGYVEVGSQLRSRQLSSYAVEHRADLRAFNDVRLRTHTDAAAHAEIGELIKAIAGQAGITQAVLISPDGTVELAGTPSEVGTRENDAHVRAAIARGRVYAGPQADRAHSSDFEFVGPVDLPTGRHAFEVTRDHAFVDAQLAAVRRAMSIIGLVALFFGAIVFYVVGGRALVRSHRLAVRRASRDGLTDLPNQRAFDEDLAREMEAATRYGDALSLVVLDLDDFKFLSDAHGRAHGDTLLQRIAGLLSGLRAGDRAYRTGGDEFAVILTHTNATGVRAAGRRLGAVLADAGIAASVGVAVMREGHEAHGLVAEADAALREARRHGGGTLVHFDDIRDAVAVNRPETVRAVHRLLAEGDITTAFQPIWSLESGTLVAVEALTRPAAHYGLAGPAQAFDVAEHLGQVAALDRLCVASALRAAREIPPGVLLFINLAPQTLEQQAGDPWLAESVRRSGLPSERVVVEVTERFGGRVPAVLSGLRALREEGFQIALDDVGSGNSGLEMLSQVGADFVKLDQSIVAAAPTEANARAVLLAMATFARQTGAFVIAEGIEDAAVLEYVSAIGHTVALASSTTIQGGQGFGLGRPSPDLPRPGARLALPRSASVEPAQPV